MARNERSRRWTVVSLGIILAIGACVHFYRISYPATPVFDEAHFATYAADYSTRHAFFDIHPAVGKLIYAAGLALSGKHPAITQFIVEKYYPRIKILDDHTTGTPYGDFPYLVLRDLSALFGILLPLAFYWFLRKIGIKNLGALFGAFLVTFDNALITQTRLILLDGFLWIFALIALALYFGEQPKSRLKPASRWILAGIFFGLALGVKLSAIVFIGPVLIDYLLNRFVTKEKTDYGFLKKRLFTFVVAGFATLALIFGINPAFFPLNGQIRALDTTLGYDIKPLATTATFSKKAEVYLSLALVESLSALPNYVFGEPNTIQSPWYVWPAKQIPMIYFQGKLGNALFLKNVVFDGNPVIWYGSTLAIIFGFALLQRFWNEKNKYRTFFILLGSDIITLLPFIFIVHRSTFLYHYLPSLFFAVGLLAWLASYFLKLDDFETLTKKQGAILFVICIAVLAGFLFVAPGTYGL
jgi:dolichyl-phosphate-mannose--protein O-mannosyl transferase